MAYNNQSGYSQSNRYDQQAGNPYAQRTQNYAQQQAANPYEQQDRQQGGYGNQGSGRYNDDDVEMGLISNGQQQPRREDPMAILNECTNIDRGVEQITTNLERLQYLQQQSLDDPDASQGTSINRQLDTLSSETMTLYRSFVGRIKKLKGMPGAGSPQNSAQVGRVDRKLKDAIQKYQTVDADFRKKLQAQMARQYRIVRPDASDAEVREATEDTSSNQVFSQALLQSDRRGQSQSALRAVQGRHEAIQKIEQQVIELAQLFQDMNELVVQQEAVVQQIDQHAEQVHENVVAGNEQLQTAVKTAYATRRKKWICLGVGVLILIIIAAIIAIAVTVTKH